MGFAQHTHEQRTSITGSNTYSPFYRLRISAEDGSPAGQFEYNGQMLNGYYEIVWFLNRLQNTPIINYHGMNGKDKILCAENFIQFAGQCPACNHFSEITTQYEGTQRENMPVKARNQQLVLPMYVPRRAQQGHINFGEKAAYKTLPIYWFAMEVTDYNEAKRSNFERLRQTDSQYPISMYPYQVFKAKVASGNAAQYYFQPVAYDPSAMGIYTQHPLLSPPYILDQNNPAQKNWDNDYYDLMEYLTLPLYVPYKYPTGEVFSYGGELQKASQLSGITQAWPKAAEKVDAQPQAMAPPPTPVMQQLQSQPGGYQQPVGMNYQTTPPYQAPPQQPYQAQPYQQPGPWPVQ